MAWTVPRTWVTGDIVTGPALNTEIRDNLVVPGILLNLVTVGWLVSGRVLVGNESNFINFVNILAQSKGSLLVGPTVGQASAPFYLLVGNDDHVLVADSDSGVAGLVGLKWESGAQAVEVQMYGAFIYK